MQLKKKQRFAQKLLCVIEHVKSGLSPDDASWRQGWRRLVGCHAAETDLLLARRLSGELQPGFHVPLGLCTPDAAQALSPPRPGRW